MKVILFTSVVLSSAGCKGPAPVQPVSCTDEARPGISITPIDLVSGQVVNASGTATVKDGAYADTQGNAFPRDGTFYLAYERPGTYSISLKLSGYNEWKLDRVTVGSGPCHVATVPLAPRVLKASSSRSAP